MKVNLPQLSPKAVWILCSLIFIMGTAEAIHAIKTLHKAKVIVEWATASELETVGFNLLRGETSTGPFKQVNSDLIPSSDDSLMGGSYRYKDSNLQAGATYFYMLEEIKSTGNSNQHGPIVVKATSSAQVELIFAVLLIGGAVVYGVLFLRSSKHPHSTMDHL